MEGRENATESYAVTDADAHYLEVLDDLIPYMEEPWKSRIGVKRNIMPVPTGDQTVVQRIQREMTDYHDLRSDPDDVIRIMDRFGFENIVLISQKMLNFSMIKGDDERMTAIANAYVDLMLDKVVDPDEGIYTLIPAPYTSPEETVDLIDRVGDERGIVGVCMITAGPEPPLGNRRYEIVYEAAEKRNLPMVFHTSGSGINEMHFRGYERFIESHTLGFLFNNVAQAVSIVVQGVPVKYPDLDIVFQESGLAWVPMLMQRLDTEYMKRQSEAPLLEKRPSEYLKEFYYGIQPLEDLDHEMLEKTIEYIGGPDQILYASDFPHWDFDTPSVITDLPFLTPEEKQRILSRNAEEVFGL